MFRFEIGARPPFLGLPLPQLPRLHAVRCGDSVAVGRSFLYWTTSEKKDVVGDVGGTRLSDFPGSERRWPIIVIRQSRRRNYLFIQRFHSELKYALALVATIRSLGCGARTLFESPPTRAGLESNLEFRGSSSLSAKPFHPSVTHSSVAILTIF